MNLNFLNLKLIFFNIYIQPELICDHLLLQGLKCTAEFGVFTRSRGKRNSTKVMTFVIQTACVMLQTNKYCENLRNLEEPRGTLLPADKRSWRKRQKSSSCSKPDNHPEHDKKSCSYSRTESKLCGMLHASYSRGLNLALQVESGIASSLSQQKHEDFSNMK